MRPETRSRIPMVVLGGWLGAGKTTLLNRLLQTASSEERIAVVVNDVGEVNLDAGLIASRDGDTVELTNGCVCCSIGDSLSATLRDLVLVDLPPDRVLVEASGIAEPDRVAAYGDRRRIRPDGIVVAVDATDVVGRAADRNYGPLVRRQAGAANVIVVTKADLATDGGASAREWCAKVAPETPVLTSGPTNGQLWIGQVLGSPTTGRDHVDADPTHLEVRPALDAPVETRSVPLGDQVDVDLLAATLVDLQDRMGPSLLRAKAVVVSADGSPNAVHLAAGRVAVEPAPVPDAAGTLILIIAPGTLDGIDLTEVLGPPSLATPEVAVP